MVTIDIIGLGAMNIDRIYQVDEIVADGEQLIANSISLPGGSAANTIYSLAKLGVKTGFAGAVGMDDDGDNLIKDLKTVNVDTGQMRVKQGIKTGATVCLSDKSGRRSLYVAPGANSVLTSEDINSDYLNQAGMVHLSSFADDRQFNIQVNLLKKLQASVKISLALGMFYASKGLKALAPLFENTDTVFMNREEIEQLTGKDFRNGAVECLNLGCRIIVVTLGKGLNAKSGQTITSYIHNSDKEYEIESEPRTGDLLETTGAGDALAAGFLFGQLKGKRIEECGLLGEIMATYAITEVGARKGLPSLAQLSQRYLERTGNPL